MTSFVRAWHGEAGAAAAFSLLGFILCYIPLAWHFEAWNVGCVLYIFWIGTSCLIQFINLIVWWDNAVNLAPVWCDIIIRFNFMARVGSVAAGLIIARRLCMITTGTTVHGSRRDKMRSVGIDLAIGLGLPIAQLIIFWFVQGHRFDIYEGFGCLPATPSTYVYQLLSAVWPIVIGLFSAAYSVRTLIAFSRRRKEFSELLASNSNLTFNRYFRLMAMACIEALCTVPFATWVAVHNGIQYPYAGLADLHQGFDRVRQYPIGEWQNIPLAHSSFSQILWLNIGCALTFFMIFGFAEEARRHYRSAYVSVFKTFGISTSMGSGTAFTATGSNKMTSSGFGRVTIPTFIQRNRSKHDSLFSFSDRLSTAISVGEFGFDDEKAAPYSPSDSTAGSSTFLPTPIDEKPSVHDDKKREPWMEADLPSLPEIAMPEPAHDVASVHRLSGAVSPIPASPTSSHHHDVDVEAQRPAPSVELPSSVDSVRHSVDMV
ncbi:a-factor receptor [Steccherinum ochraceum]|uniref:A-factor receptor n=1 Tax=Steccherinum ochraceum TaxID=92696 RepID=A0A4R0RBQ4_9APHY|nr:a-factor receptor [Steccherinum ochraceum]